MLSDSDLSQPLHGETAGGGAAGSGISGLLSTIQKSPAINAVVGLRQRMRPWTTDFAAPNRFSRPGDSWAVRLRTNVTYYKANYIAVFGGIVVFSIFSSPFLLVALIIFGAAWLYLLSFRPRLDDGSIAPITIGGRTLSGMEQKVALGGISLLTMLCTSIGSTIFWALGVGTVLIALHAASHTTEFHEVGVEEFGASPDQSAFQI